MLLKDVVVIPKTAPICMAMKWFLETLEQHVTDDHSSREHNTIVWEERPDSYRVELDYEGVRYATVVYELWGVIRKSSTEGGG